MNKVFLGFGANIGERFKNLEKALLFLEKFDIKIIKKSSIYETEPIEMNSNNLFLNFVVLINTLFSPIELLKIITEIEIKLGRKEKISPNYKTNKRINLDRTIDIDIIDYNGIIFKSKDLTLPHPRLTNRLFVLMPLQEISPNWEHPITKEKITDLIKKINYQKIKKV